MCSHHRSELTKHRMREKSNGPPLGFEPKTPDTQGRCSFQQWCAWKGLVRYDKVLHLAGLFVQMILVWPYDLSLVFKCSAPLIILYDSDIGLWGDSGYTPTFWKRRPGRQHMLNVCLEIMKACCDQAKSQHLPKISVVDIYSRQKLVVACSAAEGWWLVNFLLWPRLVIWPLPFFLQALDVIKKFKETETMPIDRAQMRLKILLPIKEGKKIKTKLKMMIKTMEREEFGEQLEMVGHSMGGCCSLLSTATCGI